MPSKYSPGMYSNSRCRLYRGNFSDVVNTGGIFGKGYFRGFPGTYGYEGAYIRKEIYGDNYQSLIDKTSDISCSYDGNVLSPWDATFTYYDSSVGRLLLSYAPESGHSYPPPSVTLLSGINLYGNMYNNSYVFGSRNDQDYVNNGKTLQRDFLISRAIGATSFNFDNFSWNATRPVTVTLLINGSSIYSKTAQSGSVDLNYLLPMGVVDFGKLTLLIYYSGAADYTGVTAIATMGRAQRISSSALCAEFLCGVVTNNHDSSGVTSGLTHKSAVFECVGGGATYADAQPSYTNLGWLVNNGTHVCEFDELCNTWVS